MGLLEMLVVGEVMVELVKILHQVVVLIPVKIAEKKHFHVELEVEVELEVVPEVVLF